MTTMHLRTCAARLALLAALATGCDGYSTLPSPPPPESPPVPEGLWTASGNPAAILRLATAQLSDTGERIPATELTTPSAGLNTLVSVAFAPDGSLWVASADDSRLLGFAPAALPGNGPRTATTVIASVGGSLAGPTGLAFDSAHRLWVANFGNGTLVRFDSAQLAVGGAPAPAVVVSGAGQPASLAFDADGALWVADTEANRIVRYDPSQLSASGSPVPAIVLTLEGPQSPRALAFDVQGNLWVSNVADGTLVSFSPGQRRASGSPVPVISISPNGESLTIPVALAFDGEGNLWVVSGTGILTKLARASLGATGAPAPAARLTIPGHSLFWSLAFWPRPNGLPLQ